MKSEVIGKIVGGFRITDLVGKGGMGAVYKAHDPELERDVALKVMDPSLARDEAFMKRFRIEAKALAQLNHAHIVKVHALRDTELGVCIVMEFVQGTTLADMVGNSGALEAKQVSLLFRQMLLAFEYAHKAGVVHRDIKPSNIMVTNSNEIKVTDFGLAKIHRHSSGTVTQLTGGTLYYVSPEQLEGLANVDHRGDIYSIGMTMYEALTGTVPFEKTESDFRIRERIVNGKIPPPRSVNPALSKPLNDFITKAIARRPEDRFQSVTDMRIALEQIELEESQKSVAKEPRRDFRKIAVAGLTILILGAVSLYLFRPSSNPHSTLAIDTNPAEALVKLNGIEVGKTPLRSVQISPGRVSVFIEKMDYSPVDTQLSVDPGSHFGVTFVLTPQRGSIQQEGEVASQAKVATEQRQSRTENDKLASDRSDIHAENGATGDKRVAAGSTGFLENKRQSPELKNSKRDTRDAETLPAEQGDAEKAEAERLMLEKIDKENRSAEEAAKARGGIQSLVDKYKTALESADIGSLKSLLQLSDKEEEGWSRFFELSKEVKVNVDDFDPQITGSRAEVVFKARVSYFNASKEEPAGSVIPNAWICENVAGKWVILSRK